MKKFRCYKCGAISVVEDEATRATCSSCGALCALAPPKQEEQQEQPKQPQSAALVPAGDSAEAKQNAEPVRLPEQPAKASGMTPQTEAAMRKSAVEHVRPHIHYNNEGEVIDAVMHLPIESVQAAIRVPMKSPRTTRILAVCLGLLGVDRFYLGDTALGVCKLIFGLFTLGIWYIVDIFVSPKRSYKKNYINFMQALGIPAVK